MSIEKYLKNTPDKTISNTAWASTDGENLKLYKLSNAGENIGLEWCYSTNFNNKNFIDNSYIRTGIDSVAKAKTGVTCTEILPLANGRYVGKFDDSNVVWDKIKGLSFGIIYFDSVEMSFDTAYICSNLDYSRLIINTSAWDATDGDGERRYLTDSNDKIITNGYRAKIRIIKTDNTIGDLSGFFLAYASIGNDNLPVIQIYNDNIGYETQVGSRWYQTNFVDGYKDSVHEYPYYSNINYMYLSLLKITHNGKYRKIFTIPHSKQAILHEQRVWTSQYGYQFASSYFSCVDVQSWTRFMNATGLRYYDGTAFTDINDIKANMYMGIMDNDGITDCDNRIKGWNEIEQSDLPNKDRNGYDWDVYDPTNPPAPPIPEIDDIEPVGYGYFSNTTMGTLYALKNKLDLEKITQWLLTQTEKIDIANNVVSLKEIPFPLSTLGITPIDTNLKIGGTNVTYQGNNVVVGEIVAPLLPTLSVVFADFDIPRMSNTFLDYSPYTKYELLVPFAPSPISLPDWVIGKNVKAIFLYDIYTTACQYVIECNGERICSVSGNFGIDRPISAQNVALKDSARLSAQIGTASSVLGGVMSGATGNVGGIISGAVGGVSALSQMILSGKQNYMYTVGANGDSSTVGLYHAAHLKITRTLSAEDDNFAHVYGRPLCKVRKLSDLTGYTKCDNVNTSGLTCSESEKQMIKNLLESGVHI